MLYYSNICVHIHDKITRLVQFKCQKKKKLSNVTTENGLKQLTKTFEQPKRESKPSMNFKIQGKKTLFLNTTSINKKKNNHPQSIMS